MRTFDVISVVNCGLLKGKRMLLLRYIRIFDVLSEVYCVLLRRTRSFNVIALYPNFDVVSEVIAFHQGEGKFLIKRL